MRKTETSSIRQVINEFLQSPGLRDKYNQYKLISQWETILGKTVSKATTSIYIKDRKLFVFLKSSVIRNELHMIKSEIIKKLNELSGEEIITDIILK